MEVKKGDMLLHKTGQKVAFMRAHGRLSISEWDHSWDSATHHISDENADLSDWRHVEDFDRLRSLVSRLAADLFDRDVSEWTLEDVEDAFNCIHRHSPGERCPNCKAGR